MKKVMTVFFSLVVSANAQAYCVSNNTNHQFNINVYSTDWYFSHNHKVEPFSKICEQDGLDPATPVDFEFSDNVSQLGWLGTGIVVGFEVLLGALTGVVIIDGNPSGSTTFIANHQARAASNFKIEGFKDSWAVTQTYE